MKVRVDQAALESATASAARFVQERPTSPVMAGVRLDATQGGLVVSAFDYDRSLRVTLDAEVGTPGSILLPGRALAGLVASLDGDVDLSDDGQRATMAAGRSRVTLPVGQLDNYPTLPEPLPPSFTMDAGALSVALKAVAWSTAKSNAGRPELLGVYLTVADGVLTLVATDTYVASARSLAVDSTADLSALISPRDLQDALPASGEVGIGIADEQVSLTSEGRIATLRTLAGEFLAWRRLIPSPATVATLDRDDLIAACTQALRAEARPKLPLVLGIGDFGITYTGGSRDESDGNAVDGSLDADVAGDGLTCGIDPAYLAAALKSLSPGAFRIGFTTSSRAVLIEQDGIDGLHIVMPIRLNH